MSENQPVPLDLDWLRKWIQPQHLDEEALKGYRDAYHAGAVPVLRVSQFLRADYAHMLHTFIATEAVYERVYGLHATARVSKEAWMAAPDRERMYQFSRLQSNRPDIASLNPLVYVKFRADLANPRFIAFFQHITDLSLKALDEINVNAFQVADYLRPHSDEGYGRRLAFILYLNPQWDPAYGGALHIVGHNNQQITLEVEHNSLVMFDVKGHKMHYVGAINESAGEQRRLSLGGWYT